MTRAVHVDVRTGDLLGELASDSRASPPLPRVRPVYSSMQLGPVSAMALRDWASRCGVSYPEPRPHVTVAYSAAPARVAATYRTKDNAYGLVVPSGGRSVRRFGDSLVLCLECPELQRRWEAWRDAGAEWSYPDYQPHVTFADLKHQPPGTVIDAREVFDEPITLLPEVVERPRSTY